MADKGGTSENIRKREIASSVAGNCNTSSTTMSQNSSVNGSTPTPTNQQYSTMGEYYESLRNWVFMYKAHTYIQHQMMMSMPYVACPSYMQQTSPAGSGVTPPRNLGGAMNAQRVPGVTAPHPQVQHQQVPNVAGLVNGAQNQQNAVPAQNINIPQIPVLEFSVPSLYRRVVAELIDFFLLFSAKLGLMLAIIDYMGISDTTGFMMRFLVEEIEDDTSLEELQQMLMFAFIYRVIVCVYETFFLGSHVNRILGGATPGKFLMKLRVISLEQVHTIGPGRVQVTLPDNVGFTQALLRSLVKNFSMAFFFPACITVFFNPHFRAAYEVLTRTMVVGTENWPVSFPAYRGGAPQQRR